MAALQPTKNPIADFAIVFSVIQQLDIIVCKDHFRVSEIQSPILQGLLALCRVERYFHAGHPEDISFKIYVMARCLT